MTTSTRWAAVVSVLFVFLSWSAHADDDAELRQIKIQSGDTAALYNATSDPANANTLIVLEPGVYALTAPLRLQRNQFLRGTNRYVFQYGTPAPRSDGGFAEPDSETILDCTVVSGPGCVFITQGGASDLSVQGASNGALVQVGGPGTSPPYTVLVRRLDIRGGQRGFRVQLTVGQASVRVDQSVMRDTSGMFSFGWQVQLSGTGAPFVDFAVSNSYISGHRYGGFVGGLGNNGTFNVNSHANRYVGNAAGLALHPGRDATALLGGTAQGSHGNQHVFISEADDVTSNGVYPDYNWPHLGGIVAITAFRTSPASGPHSHNRMWLTVKDPSFTDNRVADILAYAAVSLDGPPQGGVPSTQTAGEDNLLFLMLDVGAHTGVFYQCASIPFDPTGTNQVEVSGPDAGTIVENCAVLM